MNYQTFFYAASPPEGVPPSHCIKNYLIIQDEDL